MITKSQTLRHLGRGIGKNHAHELGSLGLEVGDVIRGRLEGAASGEAGWWQEARLTVLWVGRSVVVYLKQTMTALDDWTAGEETASFSLSCREWHKEENEAAPNPETNKPNKATK